MVLAHSFAGSRHQRSKNRLCHCLLHLKGGNPLRGIHVHVHARETNLFVPKSIAAGRGGQRSRIWRRCPTVAYAHVKKHSASLEKRTTQIIFPNQRMFPMWNCVALGVASKGNTIERNHQNIGSNLKCLLLSLILVKTWRSGNVWHAENEKCKRCG